MGSEYERFAIYWVPKTGSALSRFGSAWTGWCADSGDVDTSQEIRRLFEGCPGVPGSVARHGLHANVKSPFTLADDHMIWSLHEAIDSVTRGTAPIELPRMEVTVFDGQVVLALSRPDAAVTELLGTVASVVDPCLEPPVYAETFCEGVTQPAWRDWGSCDMPVIERFHVPLTDRLELGLAYQVVAGLRPLLDPILSAGIMLSDLALVGDPGEGRAWRLIERYELHATPGAAKSAGGMAYKGPRLLTAPFAAFSGTGRDPMRA